MILTILMDFELKDNERGGPINNHSRRKQYKKGFTDFQYKFKKIGFRMREKF